MKLYRTNFEIRKIEDFVIEKADQMTNVYNLNEAANLLCKYYDKECALNQEEMIEILIEKRVYKSTDNKFYFVI